MDIAALVAVMVLAASQAEAQDVEDPVLAKVDSRSWAPAPSDAAMPGTRLVMTKAGDVLTFTVPPHCAAWSFGNGGTTLIMSCSKTAWPKLEGPVTIRLTTRRALVPAARLDPDWAGLPAPRGQYHLQVREALALGDHAGNVEAYCDHNWYCSAVRVDGDLFGDRTELRFAATTWDGRSAGALGRAIVAASALSRAGDASTAGLPP